MSTIKKTSIKKTVPSVQKKIERIKLEAHVNAVETDRPINVSDKILASSHILRNSFKETVKWAKKNNLSGQTKELLETLADGVVIFLSGLMDNKNKE